MEKTAVKVRRYLMVSSILALAVSVAGCGGSSGGDRPGSGGTGGTPQTTASGGTTGTPTGGTPAGGTAVTGGSTGAAGTTVLSCTPGVQPAALISDFSTTGSAGWHATLNKWGTIGSLSGSPFAYAGPNSKFTQPDPAGRHTMAAAVDPTNQNLVLAGDVTAGDYAGGGMAFDQCVNTSTYTGLQFTLGGNVAGCDLYLQVQTFSQQSTSNKGGCVSNCYQFPKTKLQSATGPVTVRFADMAGTGLPVAAEDIKKEMVGLQWQLQSGAPVGDGGQVGCAGISLTIDDVSFVSN